MKKYLLLICGSFLICIVLLEISLRIIFIFKGHSLDDYNQYSKGDYYTHYIPNPYYLYEPRPGDIYYKINSEGYRGALVKKNKPANTFRILCLGGSTTFGYIHDIKKSYPYKLQKLLRKNIHNNINIEVLNFGVCGYSTAETLIRFLLKGIEYNPDLIILYHAHNDVGARFRDNFKRDYSHWKKIFAIKKNIYFSNTILEKSAIFSFLRWHLTNYRRLYAIDQHTQYPMSKNYYKIFNSTDTSAYQKNMELIIKNAQINNIKVMLSTMPYDLKTYPYDFLLLFEGQKQNNEVIRELAKKYNTLFCDFSKKIPEGREYFMDGLHLTDKGYELQAKLYADILIDYIKNINNKNTY